ncbi:GDP-mannose 4,6-dehydratase [Cellulosilyticum sp. ST5]|uniref:GDP-mannose 4,6-dehydratase n=1 Tax=unclassified Cellulosilyticum TaxID=2643091 RepID=UPI000F8CB459|nr:GDP-mannose 4,6-dehydratase [Cellulosilyticum sp. WCF-2]QEH66981.1 GDP-mannose 4,6-dehydratase [Cellulosilyticum sp. WCF-2]
MRALITGVDGFVGYYLTNHLLEQGDEVFGTTILPKYKNEAIQVYKMNLLDEQNVINVIQEIRPDVIYHLAGQSAVGLSWDKPVLTMNINVNGTIHLLEAIRKHCIDTKVLVIGSSDQYGFIKAEECPIKEEKTLKPVSPYGISKMTQEQIASLYVKSYGMKIVMVRAFNHIGPRQGKNFVVADFASKVAEIERGADPIIRVGNLEAYRDFTDVRDIVRGYHLLINQGHIGEVYNIGSGKPIKIKYILDELIKKSTSPIRVEIDENKLRPIDIPIIQCDNSKIREHVGWKPINSIDDTLESILEYWRTKGE